MRLMTFVLTLAVAVTWCCDGAMLYDPPVQRDTRWYDPRIQELGLVDVSTYTYGTPSSGLEKKINGHSTVHFSNISRFSDTAYKSTKTTSE